MRYTEKFLFSIYKLTSCRISSNDSTVLSTKDFCFSESMVKKVIIIFEIEKEKCLREDISKRYLQKVYITWTVLPATNEKYQEKSIF